MRKEQFINVRKNILSKMNDDSVMVLFSHQKNENKYDMNRNFYYATGIIEYNDILVLKKGKKCEEIFFKNPYDELKAKWVGAPKSIEEIKTEGGLTSIYDNTCFDEKLNELLSDAKYLYIDIVNDEVSGREPLEKYFAVKTLKNNPKLELINATQIFKDLRTIKSEDEIEEMKKAIAITDKAIREAFKHAKPGMMEYQVESYFDQACKFNGATGLAFTTIAASGINSTCLHYSSNDSKLEDGDLMLFDLGASLNMYCADISRTIPVNGKFSPRQKQIYNIVLGGQELIMKTAKPGLTTKELNQVLVKYYEKELMAIGLIGKPEDVKKYYFHGVSHSIGLDVHDLCEYLPLKAGTVISNEPGLYIPEEKIGIRIEDDILITEDGCINLSKDILKTVDEIEAFMEANK